VRSAESGEVAVRRRQSVEGAEREWSGARQSGKMWRWLGGTM
jgi:hypothetical protein